MQVAKPIYHLLFWIFAFFFGYDLLYYSYDTPTAIVLALIEASMHALIFYFNLYLLIPKILVPNGSRLYALGCLVFLGILFIPYYFSGLGFYLIDDVFFRIALGYGINSLLFILISVLYWYFIKYQREKQQRLTLQNEKLQAELLFLKSQVSPHFLFNSLNNIYSLSVVKHDNAPVMIEKLSDILRYVIYEGKKKEVLLDREVELIRNYFDLQLLKKLKGEENVSLSVEGLSSTQKIAPLMLINIVENCFKHSDIAYNAEGILKVDIRIEGDVLMFSAANSFKESGKTTGIGLENIKQQLKHNYPKMHQIHISDKDGLFCVDIQIDLAL